VPILENGCMERRQGLVERSGATLQIAQLAPEPGGSLFGAAVRFDPAACLVQISPPGGDIGQSSVKVEPPRWALRIERESKGSLGVVELTVGNARAARHVEP